jgi:hypothetical protein
MQLQAAGFFLGSFHRIESLLALMLPLMFRSSYSACNGSSRHGCTTSMLLRCELQLAMPRQYDTSTPVTSRSLPAEQSPDNVHTCC